jgi:hypothetical protein
MHTGGTIVLALGARRVHRLTLEDYTRSIAPTRYGEPVDS